jgi:hypothetical protein
MGSWNIRIVFAGVCPLLHGCAATYWADRWNDAKDVVTCTVGLGLGAKVRAGPLQVPLIVQSDFAGLRCGEVFASPMRDDFWTYVSTAGHVVDTPFPVYLREYGTLYSGYEQFDPGGLSSVRHKRVQSQGMAFATFDGDERNIGFYTQIEVTVGVVFSLRFGVNPGELIDALAGLTTVDVFRDDVRGEIGEWQGK